ncbi:hypothetical protein E0L36_06795 [Streptomyces sp. AJS327]|uniref:hypothetical protein n=1 Tax=Streptomyces sp. AJS327 TaxID=2545265 RepID=UPI0015DFF535|nr:hypothetical protein [Streptomyces sp. AJS327]MBA0050615.1 hypothetical protein [Streptomyces sp. AJS327]
MAMVGLFWIAGGEVFVGAKPAGTAPGARLTAEGVIALGDAQSGVHPWEKVRSLTVTEVPVASLTRRAGAVRDAVASTVVNLVLPMGPGHVEQAPARMTVRVGVADAEYALAVHVAAANGYSRTETSLSHTLLTRLTEDAGTAATTLATMAEWGRAQRTGSPRKTERERLLREWLG